MSLITTPIRSVYERVTGTDALEAINHSKSDANVALAEISGMMTVTASLGLGWKTLNAKLADATAQHSGPEILSRAAELAAERGVPLLCTAVLGTVAVDAARIAISAHKRTADDSSWV